MHQNVNDLLLSFKSSNPQHKFDQDLSPSMLSFNENIVVTFKSILERGGGRVGERGTSCPGGKINWDTCNRSVNDLLLSSKSSNTQHKFDQDLSPSKLPFNENIVVIFKSILEREGGLGRGGQAVQGAR